VTPARARLEREILEQLAAELTEAGNPVDAGQLRWVLDEFRARVMREASSARYSVTGRLQGDGQAVRA
jgi:hypothetical protein